jgi:hypothetical protein
MTERLVGTLRAGAGAAIPSLALLLPRQRLDEDLTSARGHYFVLARLLVLARP